MASPGMMLSRELQVTLQLAMTEAAKPAPRVRLPGALLYAMLHDVTTSNVLKQCGANLDALRAQARSATSTRASSAMPRARSRRATRLACSARCSARRCMRSRRDGRKSTGGNVLVAMFQETESHGALSFCRSRASRAST